MNHQPKLYSEVTPFSDGRSYRIGDWRDVPEITHNNHEIKGFFGDYRWLSNFGKAVIRLDGCVYGSVERAYQAAKWRPEDRAFFEGCTEKESITYNREHAPNGYSLEGWDNAKRDIMHALLQEKFNEEVNPDLARKLIQTGERYLEETNWWGDVYWGRQLNGEGENVMGELLMQVRCEIANGASIDCS